MKPETCTDRNQLGPTWFQSCCHQKMVDGYSFQARNGLPHQLMPCSQPAALCLSCSSMWKCTTGFGFDVVICILSATVTFYTSPVLAGFFMVFYGLLFVGINFSTYVLCLSSPTWCTFLTDLGSFLGRGHLRPKVIKNIYVKFSVMLPEFVLCKGLFWSASLMAFSLCRRFLDEAHWAKVK